MQKKFILLLFGLLLSASFPSLAQDWVRVTGSVMKSDKKTPVPGASVAVTKNMRGTVTDANGRFLLQVQKGDTLLIRALGFKPKWHPVSKLPVQEIHVNITLEEGNVMLGEVEILADSITKPQVVPKPEKGLPPGLIKASPVGSPFTYLYNIFSNEAKQRKELQRLQMQEYLEYQKEERKRYNTFFKDNTGYEN
ncbi:carboxypeptidase-like regulatory domain-containing protein [Pontibacter sp. SGAir0037]|uniref:carboxypeptidase-like regulatory domain-containing protein n=1 Tax=Pontibacter sp. SGAir0037 TaxID=2571030 RepID=UPI0010CCF2F4|nr:carboxypeptidase-like regulatory domain-containing protein [Pontibacter sp. SGAir0037]QCR21096.1 hypothetical protein C1N53_01090 [Pontibacter sp. SGAir0037]